MKFNWLPWKYIIRIAARSHGFLDPVTLLSHLSKFSQPSEVAEPIELLRAGVVFHARGLINSRVIQHNLDWVWPYWVERQFDPNDISFVPRAFSLTHVNLTHRNWTAAGVPGCKELPIVDPRGLLTPLLDKWSIDAWIMTENGNQLLPARSKNTRQYLDYSNNVSVVTHSEKDGLELESFINVTLEKGIPTCNLEVKAQADAPGWLVFSIRPYNPEGIAFVYDIELSEDKKRWTIDAENTAFFDTSADLHFASTFLKGDVFIHLHDIAEKYKSHCDIGLATAAALFKVENGSTQKIKVTIPLLDKSEQTKNLQSNYATRFSWDKALEKKSKLSIPDQKIEYLYESSVRTLVLCSPDDTFPGPYTYKRFWFRDAAFISCGLLYAGFIDRAERALKHFPDRQDRSGYFHSQEGEWDSNGEVLWILYRFYQCTGKLPQGYNWWPIIKRGAEWIIKKRLVKDESSLHAGLLPAGFSAEHLGPNDYYYWDDYWSVAGLQAAAKFAHIFKEDKCAAKFDQQACDLTSAIENSLVQVENRIKQAAIPASPYRRLDAGAIGSIVSGYPLQLLKPNNKRLINTVNFLIENCFVKNGFFQDMIHSGINPYLTLHVAQVLLRAGDTRYFELLTEVAELASPTGQWPEAVHSNTLGGCMGDGQHAWAAAEWVMMLRNCFVREENENLVLASGMPSKWLHSNEELSFGPAPTSFGNVSVKVKQTDNNVSVYWDAEWRHEPNKVLVTIPGLPAHECSASEHSVLIHRQG